MMYITRKQKGLAAAAIAILILISGMFYINHQKASEISLEESDPIPAPIPDSAPVEQEIKEISVYICGEVKNPDVVKVKDGTVLNDALALVGGPTEDADLNSINLAYRLCDQDMVKIPKKGEKLTGSEKYAPQVNTAQSASRSKGRININTADESELDTLPGVGPSTAKAIIKYREQVGSFSSIEEIKNVSGIGDSKFDQMKDSITVE
jgi:competence protein ComEA